MWGYFIRRLLLMIPTFLGITVLVFCLCQAAPGGPFDQAILKLKAAAAGGEGGAGSGGGGQDVQLTAKAMRQLKEQMGFDKPVLLNFNVLDRTRSVEYSLECIFEEFPDIDATDFRGQLVERNNPDALAILDQYLAEYKKDFNSPKIPEGKETALCNRLEGKTNFVEDNRISFTGWLNRPLCVLLALAIFAVAWWSCRDSYKFDFPVLLPTLFWTVALALVAALGVRFFTIKPEDPFVASYKLLKRQITRVDTIRTAKIDAWDRVERLGKRLIPTLVPTAITETNEAQFAIQLNILIDYADLPGDIETREELSTWWNEKRPLFTPERIREIVAQLGGADEAKIDEAWELLDEIGGMATEDLYETLDDFTPETHGEALTRYLDAFANTTGVEMPWYEPDKPDALTEARRYAKLEWRNIHLSFREISAWERAWYAFADARYGRWLIKLCHFDFGNSSKYNEPAWDVIKSKFHISVVLGLCGFLGSYLVCIPLGIMKAVKHGSIFDLTSSIIVFIGYSIPGWALGTLLLTFLAGKLHWFPLGEWRSSNWEELDIWHKIIDQAHHMVLPVFCYMVGSFAVLTVLMKNSLMENLGADYMRTAYAKGLSEKRVIFIHGLRNSMIPIATGLGHAFSIIILGGSYLIESVFSIRGFGWLGYDSLISVDYNIVMGNLVITSLLLMMGNLISDFLYCMIDPRIRFK